MKNKTNRSLYLKEGLHLSFEFFEDGSLKTAKLFKSKKEYPAYDEKEFKINLKNFNFTPLQIKIYKELKKLKSGKTLSYQELAAKAGAPKAARAVGSAMAKNPLCFVLPCHRVLRKDGKIGNYSAVGGSQTKKKLLDLERTGPKA